jgi:hypothetical protein
MPLTLGENFTSQTGTVGSWSTNAPDDFDFSGDSDGFWPVSRLRQGYIDYLTAKMLEYEEQRQARHYVHGAQWTANEIRILRARRQPIVTYNSMGRKIDQIVGLVQRLRQDPKAFPRTPKNADGAEIATLCVQAVLDSADWEFVDPFCAGQAGVEGIGGIEIKLMEGDHDDPDVGIDFVFGDDFFYDPRSNRADFADGRFHGIAKWLDVEAAVELFPDKEVELRTLMVETGFDLTTHADREYKWIYTNEKRLRLVEMWYRYRGKWMWAFFCSNLLLDQGVSPFLDERNKPMSRFVMFSAYVDHDGDRYGFPRNMKGAQDEINQRASKALFITNSTRLISQKGAVDNVETARKEYARPDGFVEYNPGFDPPKPDTKETDFAAQLALRQNATNFIESFANITPDMVTRDIPGDHSGVAINMLQKAGIAELGPYLRNYKNWKKRVYRAIWNIVRRTWTSERFLRVTDSDGIAQFIQINGVEIGQDGVPTFVNAIGNLDVEITIDEGPDEANIMQDAYDVLKGFPPGTVPPQVLITLSSLSSKMKKQVLGMMQQPPDPMAQQGKVLALQELNAKVADRQAQADQRRAGAVRDVASAAHLAHESDMRTAEFVRDGFMAAAGQNNDGAPQQNGGGSDAPTPQMGFGTFRPRVSTARKAVPKSQQSDAMSIPPDHPILQQARMGRDGRHYVPNPLQPGQFAALGAHLQPVDHNPFQ